MNIYFGHEEKVKLFVLKKFHCRQSKKISLATATPRDRSVPSSKIQTAFSSNKDIHGRKTTERTEQH